MADRSRRGIWFVLGGIALLIGGLALRDHLVLAAEAKPAATPDPPPHRFTPAARPSHRTPPGPGPADKVDGEDDPDPAVRNCEKKA